MHFMSTSIVGDVCPSIFAVMTCPRSLTIDKSMASSMKVLPGFHVSTEASRTRSRNVQVDVMTDAEVALLAFAFRSLRVGDRLRSERMPSRSFGLRRQC